MVTWEQRKLKNIAIISDGIHQTPNYVNKGIMFLSVENILNLKSKKYITSQDFENNYKTKPLFHDIFMTRIGSVGVTNILETNKPIAFYVSLALIHPQHVSAYYLNYLLKSPSSQKEIWKRTLHIAFPKKINKDEIGKINIKVSQNKQEQIKIGNLLKKMEKFISLQQRKLNELKEVKKTLLSQLFPSKGQYRPIIRFKKFTNKWTKRKLGNIAKIIGGGTPSTSNHDYWNGNINWYSPTEIGNNIFVNSSNKKISIKGLNNSSAKLLPGGKTILFTSRAGIGNMAIMLTDGCTNQGFQSWVIDDTKIDIYFLYSLGRLLKHDAIRQASGSTFLEISNKEVKKLLLEIPSFTEQKLIGNMLRKIDDDIVRQKERIILITKIKKIFFKNYLFNIAK
ncbi:restriction endonuclease subunit S [Lactobacillus amylovorus]|nr:restriction endonuclease subunit S [Lactobacillus amylovorus]MDB6254815.1 restriction endonuclease subunit S [Lactobacillus amylovorus]